MTLPTPPRVECNPGRALDRVLTPTSVIGALVGVALFVAGIAVDPHSLPIGPALIGGGALVVLFVLARPVLTAVVAGLPMAQVTIDPQAAADRRAQRARTMQATIADCARLLFTEPDARPIAVERTMEAAYQWNGTGFDSLRRYLLCRLISISRASERLAAVGAGPVTGSVTSLPLPEREIIVLVDVAQLPDSCVAALLAISVDEVASAYDAAHRHLDTLRSPP